MKVKVIKQTVTPQALKAAVEVLRKEGCDKAKKSKESIGIIEKDIDEIKKQIEVLNEAKSQ